MKYRCILLFGPPGSGKGTQGRILGAIPNFFHFACGDAFRNLRPDVPLGRVFLDYSSRGQLVPDEPTIKLWKRKIKASALDGKFFPALDILVLDGIPRNVNQARMLSESVDIKAVFNLTCMNEGQMIERLHRRALRENRLDDANLEVIKKRLDTYERETRPMLDYYRRDVVHEIDSSPTPLVIARNILDIVARVLG